ncbi:ATP-binding protein [Streptomyces sp. NPDC005480]|uniref:ATP-binding protein n=1 Tax=Streptomyces sp. NPDC005480 TaxID=3154880 RepID=UPI0033AB0354
MPENNRVPDGAGGIRTGDVSGTMVVGNHNIVNTLITAESGSSVIVHGGPLPDPVKRHPISQLPRAAAEPLIGRGRDVQELQKAIKTRQLVQVWGEPGVGKSALLRHLACELPRGPEGAAYIEAGGRTADDIAQAIFDISFDAPNYKPSLEVLKEHLKTLRLRIYLDDAGFDEKDLRRLFDMAGKSTFVFTSQQRCALDGVHAIRLNGLTALAAAELVRALLPRKLRPEEEPVVEALCDAVHGNPLRLRRIALSAATGKGLPGIADLPALLPALLNKLKPEERDLLYLLGSLSGAELAARHLDELLGRTDADAVAGGLVRHGLLLASETGYSCPPDVAECVLKSRATEYPADQLCRALTVWVEAKDTTPDDVAAHFQALDVAVLRAEKSGHARLGAALARAASPKLALSRQFDAWGSLLGVGWAAAKSAGDKEGEAFFLSEARTRRKAIGRAALTTALALEAGVLWRELAALHAHSAAHQVANAGAAVPSPVTSLPAHTVTTSHVAGHAPTVTHPTVHSSVASGHAHTTLSGHVARPVFDASRASAQPHVASHAAGTHSAAHSAVPIPKRIDLSAHSSVAHSTPPVSTTSPAASTGHTGATAAGAATTKGGMSALAVACTIGFAAVLGVGAAVYATDQPNSTPTAAPSYASAPNLSDYTSSTDDTSPSVDPVCATVSSDLPPKIQQFSTDASSATEAMDSYNTAMGSYNSGETSTAPDDSTVFSNVSTVISDLSSIESTLQGAVEQAQDSSVEADLNGMLTPVQQMKSLYQSYANSAKGTDFDTSSQASAILSAANSLDTDCGE